jgi:hypothetical protein
MVAVVYEEPGARNAIESVLLDQDEKVYPGLAVAKTESGPASSQTLVPEGVVEPAPAGDTAKETMY